MEKINLNYMISVENEILKLFINIFLWIRKKPTLETTQELYKIGITNSVYTEIVDALGPWAIEMFTKLEMAKT